MQSQEAKYMAVVNWSWSKSKTGCSKPGISAVRERTKP